MKTNIFDLSKEELSQVIKPSFRAKQIYQWLYHKYVESFSQMENIPKSLRDELEQNYYLDPLKILTVEQSIDGSKKYLFELKDKNTVESVYRTVFRGAPSRAKVSRHLDPPFSHKNRFL